MFMIDPLFCSSITRPAACANRKQPVRLTSITCCHLSSGMSSGISPHETPALLMRMSMRPHLRYVCSITAWTDSGLETSQRAETTSKPREVNSSTVLSSHSARRAQSISFAPASASPSAISRPIPREPPVTIATRPVRSNSSLTFLVILHKGQHQTSTRTVCAQRLRTHKAVRFILDMPKTQKELAFLRELNIDEQWTRRFTDLID